MKRKIISELLKWKSSPNRKPLILNGARQVGKTFVLKYLGESHYKSFVYFDVENSLRLREYFETDFTPARIVEYLESVAGQKITPNETLIVFDEIQSSERILRSLKTFCEETPEYHIATAGSLLGVAVNREKYSFPVGKVDEIDMFPMDFEEYLWATGKDFLLQEIKQHFADCSKMPNALHEECLELFRKYLLTGGMPEAVQTYVNTGSLLDVQGVQSKIVNEYIADMAKYATPQTSVKIRACYNSIPIQLAKENRKFQYKIVQKGGSATIFGESIEWLNFAGIVLKCQKIDNGNLPLAVQVDLSDFKLYMGDVGILAMKANIPPQLLLQLGEDNTYLGYFVENYVAQCFRSNKHKLFYWKNDNSGELDFVLQIGADVIPVEVKKGLNTKSRSLTMFQKQYGCPYAIRLSQKNFGFENSIKSVPLYAAFCINIK
ncbi:MAG: ATP-binding protein [Prevotellaceae bacterium]|jgi:predicted AAA+ superfamily ATPase|nr:ATP-binding protein [Prevotellaceae bacterium]